MPAARRNAMDGETEAAGKQRDAATAAIAAAKGHYQVAVMDSQLHSFAGMLFMKSPSESNRRRDCNDQAVLCLHRCLGGCRDGDRSGLLQLHPSPGAERKPASVRTQPNVNILPALRELANDLKLEKATSQCLIIHERDIVATDEMIRNLRAGTFKKIAIGVGAAGALLLAGASLLVWTYKHGNDPEVLKEALRHMPPLTVTVKLDPDSRTVKLEQPAMVTLANPPVMPAAAATGERQQQRPGDPDLGHRVQDRQVQDRRRLKPAGSLPTGRRRSRIANTATFSKFARWQRGSSKRRRR